MRASKTGRIGLEPGPAAGGPAFCNKFPGPAWICHPVAKQDSFIITMPSRSCILLQGKFPVPASSNCCHENSGVRWCRSLNAISSIPFFTIGCFSTGNFKYECPWITLINQSKFAIGKCAGSGIQEYSSFDKVPV